MPSPLAHALAGLTVHVVSSRDRADVADRWRAAVTVGAALAPDLDLAFKYVDGRNHHNGELHSIGFALLAAATGALVFRLLRWRAPLATAFAVLLGWTSHLVLDFLNVDTNPPIGLLCAFPVRTGSLRPALPRHRAYTYLGDGAPQRRRRGLECAVLVPLLVPAGDTSRDAGRAFMARGFESKSVAD